MQPIEAGTYEAGRGVNPIQAVCVCVCVGGGGGTMWPSYRFFPCCAKTVVG